MDTDFLLIRKMKQGDEDAFDRFVHKYYEEILSYCSRHYYDTGSAEDLTQETFLHFFTKLSDYHYKGKTKNYLYTIAGNLCKDYYKKKKDILAETEDLDRNASMGANQEDILLDKVVIEEALRRLPEEYREVIILYYFQNLKLSEIAGVLQINLSLVKYRIRQAKKQLEQYLGEEDFYESG